jgi:hypothetical protein
MADFRVEMDEKSLQRFVFAVRLEQDGRALAADFRKHIRVAAQPAKAAAQTAILSMPSSSTRTPGLRQTIAAKMSVDVKTGKRAGVAIRAKKTPGLRGFATAPKRTNRKAGWRHPLFGNEERWYDQVGLPGWFDDTIPKFAPSFLRAGKQVMDDMAARISQRSRG